MSIPKLAAATAAVALLAAAYAGAVGTRLPTDPTSIEKTLCAKLTATADRRQCARVAAAFASYNAATNNLANAAARLNAAGDALVSAAKMSYNLQYLQLQNAMQNENRDYTAISNIMKTKHDTVKNSISNIR